MLGSISAIWLPLEAALERAGSGEIDDGKTVVGLFRAQHQLRR